MKACCNEPWCMKVTTLVKNDVPTCRAHGGKPGPRKVDRGKCLACRSACGPLYHDPHGGAPACLNCRRRFNAELRARDVR
jgi:hypothetical protein